MTAGVRTSVVIIMLNAERFVRQAIDSILAQTVQDWELILVDDGSIDGTIGIAEECVRSHPGKIRLLRHQGGGNRGMSASRNLGIAHSRGEFVAFLDADDLWLPGKLEAQVRVMDGHPEAALAYCPVEIFFDDPASADRAFIQPMGQFPPGIILPPRLLKSLIADFNIAPCPSAMLIRRRALEEIGGFEPSSPNAVEDQYFLAKITLRYPVYRLEKALVRYRRHDAACGVINAKAGRGAEMEWRYARWLFSYLRAQPRPLARPLLPLARRKYASAALAVISARLGMASLSSGKGGVVRAAGIARAALKAIVPAPARRRLRAWWERRKAPRRVDFGGLRRLAPVSRIFGFDRGTPVDRYYIEAFLRRHSGDIRGRVLEIADPDYTQRFGGDRVIRSDVLHAVPGNPRATLVGDLATGEGIPKEAFDCLILTQTFLVIYEVRSAVANAYATLKPGGVLLATFPGISQISRADMDRWGDYWRFTSASARRLFGDVFGPENVTVETHGNVLASCAFLYGIAAEELKETELNFRDQDYQLLITVRAVKGSSRPGGDNRK